MLSMCIHSFVSKDNYGCVMIEKYYGMIQNLDVSRYSVTLKILNINKIDNYWLWLLILVFIYIVVQRISINSMYTKKYYHIYMFKR